MRKLIMIAFVLVSGFYLSSCSKNQKSSNSSQLQVRLTDSPDPSVKEVWVDVRQIEIIMGDTSHPIILNGAHPGVYNLLDLTNGKDTI
ncbi:MAG TPA: DUF4382 domain-containing protein, partial [Puia sp.]